MKRSSRSTGGSCVSGSRTLKSDIAEIQERKTRLVAQRNLEHFTVCIVGYTNAGKSTLFNTLTAAGTYADDKLFATLDTKTRAWKLERGTEVLLSDTVGFVRDLPHNLVASFKATLEEAVHADLLLHVVDVGHPHAEQQFQSVHKVLEEIGAKVAEPRPAGGKPELLLLNKIDTEEGEAAFHTWRTLNPEAIGISAKTGRGLDQLQEAVYKAVRGQQVRRDAGGRRHERPADLVHRVPRPRARPAVQRRARAAQGGDGQAYAGGPARNDQVEVQKVEPLT